MRTLPWFLFDGFGNYRRTDVCNQREQFGQLFKNEDGKLEFLMIEYSHQMFVCLCE